VLVSTGGCPKELLIGKAAFMGSGVFRGESSLHIAARVRDNRRTARCTRQARLPQVSCRVGGVKQLPIFPLNMVGLPDAKVTLHIFEARYRVLFNTLLYGLDDVEEGMVQKDSVFCGTRRFGLVYVNPRGGLASIGCCLEIEKHRQLEDGRLLVVMRGVERFRIRRVVADKPVLITEVEVLEDEEDEETLKELEGEGGLAEEVRELFCNTLTLGRKMQGKPAQESFPSQLFELPAPRMSFWIAGMFSGAEEQQQLLELSTCRGRLEREKEILKGTLDYLTASAALKSALGEMPSDSS